MVFISTIARHCKANTRAPGQLFNTLAFNEPYELSTISLYIYGRIVFGYAIRILVHIIICRGTRRTCILHDIKV